MLRDAGTAKALQLIEPQRVDAEQDDVRTLAATAAALAGARCPTANADTKTTASAAPPTAERESRVARNPMRRAVVQAAASRVSTAAAVTAR